MKIIKYLGKQKLSGKLRETMLVECVKCGKQKVTRTDSPQKTDMCSSCAKQKHGMTNTRLYIIWNNMKSRCTNPNNSRYSHYGAKGVTVCHEWLHDFTNFQQWAESNGYNEELTIDRIDSNGNYEPLNCRWTTNSVQTANRNYPVGKAGYYGVVSRYIAQVRYEGNIILNQDCNSIEEAAYVRELFIIKNNLPHPRNFPNASVADIEAVLTTLKEPLCH